MKIHFDKCFLNGELIKFKELDNEIKYNENRLSYTSVKTLNICPYRFFNESWDEIGLSNNDSSAHGTFGHYIIGEYLNSWVTIPDFNFDDFVNDVTWVAEEVLTTNKLEARTRIVFSSDYLKHTFYKLYVTTEFSVDKFLKKITGYLEVMDNILYHLPKDKIRNLYVETGIYNVNEKGQVTFGKADLIIEFTDGTYTLIDHKSSLNPLFFEPLQLKMYALLLNRPVRELAVYELSTGNYIRYTGDIKEHLIGAKDFIKGALSCVNRKDKSPVPGEHCSSCTVDCLDSITNDDGYVTI